MEKPYNRQQIEAAQFVEEVERLAERRGSAAHTVFFGLDHYHAKIFDYIMKREDLDLETQTGHIREIEFALREIGPVEPWRATTLGAGLLYDLLPYILAMISSIVDLRSLTDSRRIDIKIARHDKCPFDAKTYAWIKAEAMDHKGSERDP